MILAFGASAKLGSTISKGFLDSEQPVGILGREHPVYQAFVQAGVQQVRGNFKDQALLDATCRDVEAVITTATATQRSGPNTLEHIDMPGLTTTYSVTLTPVEELGRQMFLQ